MPDHSIRGKKKIPVIQSESPLSQFKAISCRPAGTVGETSSHLAPSFQGAVRAIRWPLSLLFLKLNKPSSLDCPSYDTFSSPFTSPVVHHLTHSSSSTSFSKQFLLGEYTYHKWALGVSRYRNSEFVHTQTLCLSSNVWEERGKLKACSASKFLLEGLLSWERAGHSWSCYGLRLWLVTDRQQIRKWQTTGSLVKWNCKWTGKGKFGLWNDFIVLAMT